MRKFLFLIFALLALSVRANPIEVYYKISVGPGAGPTSMLLKQIEAANGMQTKYKIIPDFKVGAGGLIAAKSMEKHPANSILGIGPHFQHLTISNKVNGNDYRHLPYSGFDMCVGIHTNIGDMSLGVKSLESYKGKEIVVGVTAPGAPAHLTAIVLSEKYGFKIRLATFKSDKEAFMNMVAGHGVNFATVNPAHYVAFKDQQPNLKVLAVNCPTRLPTVPDVKTLDEQGITAPKVFNAIMARKEMPTQMQEEIGLLLQKAADEVDMWNKIPIFIPNGSEKWFKERTAEQHKWLTLLSSQI